MFKTKAQVREQAEDILRDAPVETLRLLVKRLEHRSDYNDQQAYPVLASWLIDILDWQLEVERYDHEVTKLNVAEKPRGEE